ncbi:DUF3854 domain-containing protein [Nostoc sp.]|uniref:DUF3854 domain-containing protein n=1 Tax=Nostoc sp. TaxID=1180 RepID=UPI002FF42841
MGYGNPEIPVCLTEGEKKAACLLTLGFVVIALPGIWNGRVGKEDLEYLHPDLVPMAQQAREQGSRGAEEQRGREETCSKSSPEASFPSAPLPLCLFSTQAKIRYPFRLRNQTQNQTAGFCCYSPYLSSYSPTCVPM